MEKTLKIQLSDNNCHTLLDVAKMFFAKPENKAGFEKWEKEQKERKKAVINE